MKQMEAWVLTGPTAGGKTALSLNLAMAEHCEILCMDSMQIYRHMDIGTAKPTPAERALVPHHLLDLAEPGAAFSVADYLQAAQNAAKAVLDRGHIPLFVGGTGFYLRALRQNLTLGRTGADPALRADLEAEAEKTDGRQRLWERLREADPETAARLHPNDARRVIRALEVFLTTGQPISHQRADPDSGPFRCRVAVLSMDRQALYGRIDRRVDRMLQEGLEEEVFTLIRRGVSPECQAMQGIGYKEWLPFFAGACSREETANQIRQNSRHYAKRQLTWFRREAGALWLNAADPDTPRRLTDYYLRGADA